MEIVNALDAESKKIIIAVVIVLIGAFIFEKQRNIILGAGFYRGLSWVFDNPIWITAELIWGARGALGMAIAAVLINIFLFIYFRNKEAKFVVWNSLKGFSEKELEYKDRFRDWRNKKTPLKFILVIGSYVPMKIFFFLLKIVKIQFWGNFFALIILSIFEDPFIATTYVKDGNKKDLDFKIISIFLLSILISIGYWSIRNGLITEFIIRPIVF
ncbi:MAG: hypothetical protein UR66_C0018G0025 [Candidatus Moranbacteria bacterium GW2011_GWE1_35_17]|nr:MAG: hypothetical protein UR66_C0018G0025 [Candidatus Moranbacteria bacterium GW2011_GWE1_35_17]KKP83318.1 MAG: hypothetical protein UR82_C0022G0011 [Candidatus Moranbacteria bacterium GW2011_GWF1_35_5]KKP84710.1 MAG: hypothetical protein UR83_C0014G0013 [Candidatus Moranbacteria bacterium GW2011_GWF2_35_54]